MSSDTPKLSHLHRRTLTAIVTLTLLLPVPALAQVVIGGGTADTTLPGDVRTESASTGDVPNWLMKYLPDDNPKKKEQAKKALKVPKIKESTPQRRRLTDAERNAVARKNFAGPAPQRRIVTAREAAKELPVSPWSPRSQSVDQPLFPELDRDRNAVLAAPKLGGAKAVATRAATTLPPVLTPDLMDSMILAAREDAQTPQPSSGAAPTALADAGDNLVEGAYSPQKAGTADRYTLGTVAGVPSQVAAAPAKKTRKLFSSDDTKVADANAKQSSKLLLDIEQEPQRDAPASTDSMPATLPAPVPTPAPSQGTQSLGTITRREDDVVIPEKHAIDDSLKPLESMEEQPQLLASKSEDMADISAKEALIAQKPAPDIAPDADEQVLAEIGQEVEKPSAVPAPVVTADAVADEFDITQMASAPRLLGRASDSVDGAAPTPKAAPVPAVTAEAEPAEIEVKVETPAAVDVPDADKVEIPSVAVMVDEASPVEEPKPAQQLAMIEPALPEPAPEVKAPEVKIETPPAKVDVPEIKVDVPEVKVEAPPPVVIKPEPKKIEPVKVETPEIKVEVPDIKPVPEPEEVEVAIEIPEEPVLEVPVVAAKVEPPKLVPKAEVPEIKVETPQVDVPEIRVEAPSVPPSSLPPARKDAPVAQVRVIEPVPPPRVADRIEPTLDMPPRVVDTPPMPPQSVAPPVALAPAPVIAAPTTPQKIIPPPNLRVETPAGMGLRTPRLVPDTPKPAARSATDAVPLASITPDSIETPALPATAPRTAAPAPKDGIAQTIYFAPDTRDLDDTSKKQIDDLAELLDEKPDARVMLTAYADANLLVEARRMALARALAIRSRLASQGIQPVRIDVRALGELPANDNGVADRVDVSIK
ncbi:MAG: OmpA family protein [Bdellovibrionales bacterium]